MDEYLGPKEPWERARAKQEVRSNFYLGSGLGFFGFTLLFGYGSDMLGTADYPGNHKAMRIDPKVPAPKDEEEDDDDSSEDSDDSSEDSEDSSDSENATEEIEESPIEAEPEAAPEAEPEAEHQAAPEAEAEADVEEKA